MVKNKAMTGIELIAQERTKCLQTTGKSLHSDLRYNKGELSLAAASILSQIPTYWPFASELFYDYMKRSRSEQLAIAGQFVAADIDRVNYAYIEGQSDVSVWYELRLKSVLNEDSDPDGVRDAMHTIYNDPKLTEKQRDYARSEYDIFMSEYNMSKKKPKSKMKIQRSSIVAFAKKTKQSLPNEWERVTTTKLFSDDDTLRDVVDWAKDRGADMETLELREI